jgi:hypothetical protein
MSIIKKLTQIQESVMTESRLNSESLLSHISSSKKHLSSTQSFLSKLSVTAHSLKYFSSHSRTSDFPQLIRSTFSVSSLIDTFRELKTPIHPPNNFDISFLKANKKFDFFKMNLQKEFTDFVQKVPNFSEILKSSIESCAQREQAPSIIIPRWMGKEVAELIDGEWKLEEVSMRGHFFPFSKIEYLSKNEFLVMGGLNDTVNDKPHFTDQVLKVTEVVVSPLKHFYAVNQVVNLNRHRGCFTSAKVK